MVLIDYYNSTNKYLATSGALHHKFASPATTLTSKTTTNATPTTTMQQQQQQQPPQQLTARLLVLGHKGVGKSASIVRYTTGRFIHQYSESTCDWLYKQTLSSPDYHFNRENNKFSNTINHLGQLNLILPNCVELLEQKDIPFTSASNFMAPASHIQQQQQINVLNATKCKLSDPKLSDDSTTNSDNKCSKLSELNESLLFSSRVALDRKIDNELHAKQKLLNKLCWANAYIVIYAINDVSTFNKAIKYLNLIANNINSPLDNQSKANRGPHSNMSSSSSSGNSYSNTKQSNHPMTNHSGSSSSNNNNSNNSSSQSGRKTKSSFLKSVSPYHSNSTIINGTSGPNSTLHCAVDRSLTKPRRPILLLGNKLDLDSDSTRQVSLNEGRRLALRHQTLFAEVSIAESAEQLVSIFFDLIQQVDPLSYHLSELKSSLNPCASESSTTISQWRPEVADGPVFGNIVKSRPRYFTSIARSCRVNTSLDSATQVIAAKPMIAKPLKMTSVSGGRSAAETKSSVGGSKLDFKASFRKASMAIVGSRAIARQAASKTSRKTDSMAEYALAKIDSSSETEQQRSQLSPATLSSSSSSNQHQYLSSSGRNSCDSSNSISASSGNITMSGNSSTTNRSKMSARLSTSSASSAATSTTTTTSTNWFGWTNNTKLAGEQSTACSGSGSHYPPNPNYTSGQQSHQLGHRRGDSIASSSPMSLSSPSSTSEPKLSSSSIVLGTLSTSNDSNVSGSTTTTTSTAKVASINKSQQQQQQHNNLSGGSGSSAGFGSRFKKPLFKYKSRRKTVAFEPATLIGNGGINNTACDASSTAMAANELPTNTSSTDAVYDSATSMLVNGSTSRDKQDNMIMAGSYSPTLSLHSASSTLDSCSNNNNNNKINSFNDRNRKTAPKRVGKSTNLTSASFTAVSSLVSQPSNAKSSPNAQVMQCCQQRQQQQHDEDSAKSSGRSSASFSLANTLPTMATPTTTTTTTSAPNTYQGSYYVLCDPEQVVPMNTCSTGVCSKQSCPKHATIGQYKHENNSNNVTQSAPSEQENAIGLCNNENNSNNNSIKITNVNKTIGASNRMYASRKSSRSTLSRASTSGGSYEIDDSCDDLSASSSYGASQSKLMTSSGILNEQSITNNKNNNNNIAFGSHVAVADLRTHKAPQLQTATCAPVLATVVRQKTSGNAGIHLVKSVQSTLNSFTRSSSTTAQVAKKSFCQVLTKYLNSPNEPISVAKSTAAIPAASMALVATDLVRSNRNNAKSNQQQGQHRVLSH